MLLFHFKNFFGRYHISHQTSCISTGDENALFGVHDLGAVGHKADAAKNDDILVGRACDLCKLKTVAAMIGNKLDRKILIIMGENKGALFLFQLFNIF
jgi:hypothetical protein